MIRALVSRRRRSVCAFGALLLLGVQLGVALPARGYETDQYSNRLLEIDDAAEPLNRIVNEALHEVVSSWKGRPDDLRLAWRIYWRLGGIHWVDRIERKAMKSPEVERLPQRRRHGSVYSGAPLRATRVNFVFGVGRTVRLAGVLIGSDKLGHFFSQGLKYYRRHHEGRSESDVMARGRFAERWLFGQLTTGVYSNADLVANYEGYRFYRGLFEDDVVRGKGAIVEWVEGRPVLKRGFDWADHVNDFWDEALNPSWFSPPLGRWMASTLPSLCEEYRRRPDEFVPERGKELRRRYEGLGLKEALVYRLDRVCAPDRPAGA